MRVAVIGASGYVGGELLRILAVHEHAEVTVATSETNTGRPVHHVHFNLKGFYRNLRFMRYSVDSVSKMADAAFLALPHGQSLHLVPELLEVGMKVVDLSADYRLRNPEDYRRWYGYTHPYPDLLSKAVYGMPEIHRERLRGAELVASPGCNATASILALLPLASSGLLSEAPIIIDVKAGSSEAGSRPSLPDHHPEREGAIRPYAPEGHRHAAEVSQEIGRVAGREVSAYLTPHAVPAVRGALASAYVFAGEDVGERELVSAYARAYGKEPFIRIVRNTPIRYPSTKYVVGSNYADVSFAVEGGRLIKAFAAIDNLMKGAAGQAVQAFNVAVGFDETDGLKLPPLRPV